MSKILIIDDSKFQRNAIVRMVKEIGHEVVEAKNGKEGLLKVSEESPNCVITDLHMPELDGFGFLESVYAEDNSFKIIVMSADIQEGTQNKIQSLGGFAFLTKPVQIEVLSEVLAKALEAVGG